MITEDVARYVVEAGSTTLPAEVDEAARVHVLDSVAAVAAGMTLAPGRLGRELAVGRGGLAEATVLGADGRFPAAAAAFAHGMAAHADESDDSHEASMSHPGCSIVPAALAVGESQDATLGAVLRAVASGYDVGTRVNLAIGIENLRPWDGIESSHAITGVFGSAAACASLLRLDVDQTRTALSYAAQQAAGLGTAFRDRLHVEKAFVFAGMPARNGVEAALMVAAGFTGVPDVFEGSRNFFQRFRGEPDPGQLVVGLGERFEIAATNIKKYSVGSPNQTVLECVERLYGEGVRADDVATMSIVVPEYVVGILTSAMPDISSRYLAATTLLDGGFTFAAAHDHDRMRDGAVQDLMPRIVLAGDPELGRSRAARVEVRMTDSSERSAASSAAPGSVHNPMTVDEVQAKARQLLGMVMPSESAERIANLVLAGREDEPVRHLAGLLAAGSLA